jgi:hypothetical protein
MEIKLITSFANYAQIRIFQIVLIDNEIDIL